jgi:hypothetical protein
MTVYIEKPALNLREELASLRNQGGYQEQKFYFDSKVTNGTFDANINGWTNASTGTGTATWNAGGYLQITRSDASNIGKAYQEIKTVVGSAYSVSWTLAAGSSGYVALSIGTTPLGTQNQGSTVSTTVTFTATSLTTYVNFTGNNNFTSGVDNVSVFETDGTDIIYTMPKGWEPKDVFEDGLLQREGAANDYEVVYDGFDYVIKPTVAPSATTQTCVIGVKA